MRTNATSSGGSRWADLRSSGSMHSRWYPDSSGSSRARRLDDIVNTLGAIAYSAVPIGIGIAILKYRLYDIDIVIRKALVFASLAAFFTVVYVLVVGGVGAVMGSLSTPTLSFAAAALVAIGFQPALARARRFADRVVYGKRSTPYEVLAELGERLGETYAADDVLPRIARVLGEGVGADRADVLLLVEDAFRAVASWPEAAAARRRSRSDGRGAAPGRAPRCPRGVDARQRPHGSGEGAIGQRPGGPGRAGAPQRPTHRRAPRADRRSASGPEATGGGPGR